MEETKTTLDQMNFTITNIVDADGKIMNEQNLIAIDEEGENEFELIRSGKEDIFYMRMGEISLILRIDMETLLEQPCYYTVQRYDYQQYHDVVLCFQASEMEMEAYHDCQPVEKMAVQKSLKCCPRFTH